MPTEFTPLAGKVAIVTGSGRGLGRAEALELARAGATVLVNDLGVSTTGDDPNASVAQGVVDEIISMGGQAAPNSEDISSVEGAQRMVEMAIDRFGRLDILVNNAGFARPAPIYDMSEPDFDDVVKVHLKGHFACIRAAAPIFKKQRSGVIVNTSSQSALGHWGMSNYAAAKEAVVGFTRSLARDLGPFGVRCNAVRPLGITRLATPDVMETVRYSQEELGIPATGNVWVAETTRIPEPEQVGVFVAWLCSDSAKEVNGRTFFAGGGTVGLYPEPILERAIHQPEGWTLQSLTDAAAFLIEDVVNPFQGKSPA